MCPARLRKNRATQLDPQHCWMIYPLPDQELATRCQPFYFPKHYAVIHNSSVSYATFIVIETVIVRYLAVKTLRRFQQINNIYTVRSTRLYSSVPLLETGTPKLLVVRKTNKPLASRNQHKTN